jgi:hypothetical protein
MPWDAPSRRRSVVVTGAAGVGGVLLLLGQGASPCHTETRYTCIRLSDHALPGGGLLRLMMLDESPHSASDRDDPGRLHFAYTALVDRLSRPVWLACQSRAPCSSAVAARRCPAPGRRQHRP